MADDPIICCMIFFSRHAVGQNGSGELPCDRAGGGRLLWESLQRSPEIHRPGSGFIPFAKSPPSMVAAFTSMLLAVTLCSFPFPCGSFHCSDASSISSETMI